MGRDSSGAAPPGSCNDLERAARYVPAVRIALLTFLLAAAVALPARGEVHAENFKKGVNLSHWYAQSPVGTYEPERLATYFTIDDAKLIADAGFDHVRLTVDFDALEWNGDHIEFKGAVRRLWAMTRFLNSTGLGVVLDLHPSDDFKASLADPWEQARLVIRWQNLASLFASVDPDLLWFEVMNEPHGVDGWRDLQLRVVKAIRTKCPNHAIVVTGGGWSNASTLYGDPDDPDNEPTQPFEPYEGIDDLVYTFHYYEPFMFTHQAAEWGWAPAARTKGLGWPVDPADANAVADAATRDAEAHGHVRYQAEHGYFTEDWTKHKLDAVAAWQKQHGVVVYLGEMGVYAKDAPRDARLAWHRFVAEQCEANGWGFAVWDYSGGFAMFPGDPGERQPDVEMLEALGVSP